MGDVITVRGHQYAKRNPLAVLGLSIITLGIYWFYWYYRVHDEIRRFENDLSVRPGKALLAVTLGWLLIVPPFISIYNLSVHVARIEERARVQPQLSPALNVVLLLVLAFGIGMYTQEHLNRIWESAAQAPAQNIVMPAAPAMPVAP